ncbi:MAG TPA: RagB/SusD family nutrient uptake outer membrane protein [Puia sp.]|jgi:hypothetical protein
MHFCPAIRCFLFVLLSGLTLSCRKAISVPPPTDQLTTAAVFADDAHAIAAQNGVYTDILSDPKDLLNEGLLYTSLSADELSRVQSLSPEDVFTLNLLPADNPFVGHLYTSAYSTTRGTNIILEQLPSALGISDSTRKQLTGESKLVRALAYVYLLNLWGDVPLVLSSDYTTTNNLPRTPIATVYEQIVRDLVDAQGLLGAGYRTYAGQPADRSLPNQATATAILARVYLYEGNWAGAVQQASAVIGDSRYHLESNLDRVFLSTSNEAIWQLRPLAPSATAAGAIFLPVAGLRPTYVLTPFLLNAFEAGDQRKARWTRSMSFMGKTYVYPYKYKIGSSDTMPVKEYTTVVRLAEMFLIRAEAAARLGQITEALGDLNTIRSRAGLPPLNTTDTTILLAAIGHERQVELFTEYGHRWLDLKRTGQVNAVLSAEKTGWQPYDALYPFPTQELQRNPSLIQNAGY